MFAADRGRIPVNRSAVYGVISMIIWTLVIVVTFKYVALVMRADNDGEGGMMALVALIRRLRDRTGIAGFGILIVLGVFGASLFFGDAMITPAISVLSAVEGLKVVNSSLGDAVIPIALAVLLILFAAQRFGTGTVGRLFGPVMIVWFCTIAVAGAVEIARAWLWLVFPALLLNYMGQGAHVLAHPAARANPFFLLVPGWAQVAMVLLATVATVIASQSVIAGAFSLGRQAAQLGYLPRLTVRHTSRVEVGQVYLPAINAIVLIAVVLLVLGFRSSANLAAAYGFLVVSAVLGLAAAAWPARRAASLDVLAAIATE